MTVLLAIVCVVLAALLGISVMFNIRHGKILLDVQDAVEEALDVCDTAYGNISSVVEPPIMLTTPEGLTAIEGGIAVEAHVVVSHMRVCRDSVLYVSNVLAAPYGGITEEEEGNGNPDS